MALRRRGRGLSVTKVPWPTGFDQPALLRLDITARHRGEVDAEPVREFALRRQTVADGEPPGAMSSAISPQSRDSAACRTGIEVQSGMVQSFAHPDDQPEPDCETILTFIIVVGFVRPDDDFRFVANGSAGLTVFCRGGLSPVSTCCIMGVDVAYMPPCRGSSNSLPFERAFALVRAFRNHTTEPIVWIFNVN